MTMRLIIPLSALFLISLVTYSQSVSPRDVRRVTVTSSYILEDGDRTNRQVAINQEIFDSLGRPHTVIDFDPQTGYPGNYRWLYHDSMLLVRTDHFTDEKLDKREVLEYRADSLIEKRIHYRFVNDEALLHKTVEYTYNSEGLPGTINAYDISGRRLYRVRSSFDEQGTETRRRVSGRRGEPEDGIIRLDRKPEYDERGFLVSEVVNLRESDRSRSTYQKRYTHDDRELMVEMTMLDGDGNQLKRIEYIYQDTRDRLIFIKTYDQDNRLTEWLEKRYEIYSDGNRRQRIIDY